MKERDGFVSNSSSCSFIISDKRERVSLDLKGIDKKYKNSNGKLYVPTVLGNQEFGWAGTYTDIYSRINWVCAQIESLYSDGDKKLKDKSVNLWKMFVRVCESNGVRIVPNPEFDPVLKDRDYVYIDHQSQAKNNERYLEIFESDKKLADFVFGKNSKIICDNDNHL